MKSYRKYFLKMKLEKFRHFNPEILTNFREKTFENCWIKPKIGAAHYIVLAKCGLEFCIEFVKFTFAAAFHIVFLCNLVNLKKHRLRLGILELKFFEFPALRQYFFVVCNCLKKFRLKFWILILQKSEENSHLNLTKFNRKIFSWKQNWKK